LDFDSILKWLQEVALWLVGQWQVQTLAYMIAGNFVVAVAVSVATGEFRLGRLAEVLYRKVLPWLGVYAFFSLVGEAINLEWVATAAWGLLTGKLIGDLLDSLGQLGIFKEKIPAQLKK